jgi:glycosyltransferase involved in cell wall biosynthesis
MNILILCNKVPYPPADGGTIATLQIAEGLSRSGNSVSVLAMNTRKHYVDPAQIPPEIQQKLHLRLVSVDAEISFLQLIINLLFSGKPYTATRFEDSSYARTLIEILREKKFDIIQLEGLYLMHYIPVIRENSEAQIAYRSHNVEHEIWERVACVEESRIRRLYLRNLSRRIKRLEEQLINQYDLFIPITGRDGRKYNQMGNTRPMKVVPTGIDPEAYQLVNTSSDPNHLFHIGALDWAPNQEGIRWFLLDIWPEVLKRNHELTFHVAGRNAPGWLVSEILSAPNTVYHGEVNDAHDFIREHGLMIVALRSGSGMRIKMLEGMALAKCILSTSIGCEGIDAEDGRHLVLADQESDFIGSVVGLTSQPGSMEAIGKEARTFVAEKYNNDLLTKELSDFYMEQLKDKKVVQ